MRVQETKKVNIFELFILMIVMARASISIKMKMMLCLLDFEKKKVLSADVLHILSTLFVVAVSRLYTIKMNSFTNKELLEFVQTLGEAYKMNQQIDYATIMQWVDTEDLITNFFKNFD